MGILPPDEDEKWGIVPWVSLVVDCRNKKMKGKIVGDCLVQTRSGGLSRDGEKKNSGRLSSGILSWIRLCNGMENSTTCHDG